MYEQHVGITGKTEKIRTTKRRLWKEFVLKGIKEVEKEYGNIRIVQVGKAIAENTNW